jgi:DnaK suppressor protein
MLTNEQTGELRAQVEAELAAIRSVLSGKASDSMELDQTRVGRLSRMDAMQQQAMDTGMKERLHVRIRRLEAALVRIQEGSYGVCCKCGEAIAKERMAADIAAPFCAVCQEEIDDRHKTA